jgi:alpha-1,2-mannosyltransferase
MRRRPRATVGSAVLVTATAVAIALRLYQLTRPGYLLGVSEYDGGVYFGSAVLLVHGYLPYRDFILVQPPGITMLMAPVAALTQGLGTAWGMGVGRILTAVAGGAAAGLGGRLVRHRGLLAVLLTSGIIAVYPSSVRSTRTVLLEPWLVLFCLLGALAVFDGDRLSRGRRLTWGGIAFGFAGAVKVWAILPVVAILVLILTARQVRGALFYLPGVAAGFLIPVLPFASLAPRSFYRDVVMAQLVRTDTLRTPLSYRLQQMTGLTDFPSLGGVPVTLATLAICVAVVGSCLVVRRLGHGPTPLDQFAFGTGALIIVAFLWPADFYYHYAGFLAPFLALAVGLPVARLVNALGRAAGHDSPSGPAHMTVWAVTTSAALLVVMVTVQARSESSLRSSPASTSGGLAGDAVSQAGTVIPTGSCLLTDKASYAIAADRLVSTTPGCVPILDGVGTDYSLSGGRTAANGAQRVSAVRELWLSGLRRADYVWLSPRSSRRIPWTVRSVSVYFDQHFQPTLSGPAGLYVRSRLAPRPVGDSRGGPVRLVAGEGKWMRSLPLLGPRTLTP